MYQYKYGGKNGKTFALEESKDLVVVRTNDNKPLEKTRLSRTAKDVMNQLVPVGMFSDVGVSIMQCNEMNPTDALLLRDQARAVLKQEEEIRFAGRVLVDSGSGSVMLYTENFFVKFFDNAAESLCLELIKNYNLTLKFKVEYAQNAYFLGAPEGTGLKVFEISERLLHEPIVEYCHPELVRERKKKVIHPWQWHLKKSVFNGQTINAHANVEEAWKHTQGEGVIIAIIDDGVDIDHPEFGGRIVAPRDVALDSNDPRPKGINDNHGTCCAGVALAGGIEASGIAPKALLMPIRNSNGLGTIGEAEAFYWAVNNGADIISCSWGPDDGNWQNPGDPLHKTFFGLPDSSRLALEYATDKGRKGKGCVVVWAAGNGNENIGYDGYASFERVLAVAASNDSNKRSVYSDYGDNIWCCFPSNDFGSTFLNHPLPRTFGVYTTDRLGAYGYNPKESSLGDLQGNYTATFGGTSSSCPGVAGVVALMLAVQPNLTWQEVKEVIKGACVKIDTSGGQYNSNGHSIFYGYGRIDAAKAVIAARDFGQQATVQPIQPAFQEPVLSAKVTLLTKEVALANYEWLPISAPKNKLKGIVMQLNTPANIDLSLSYRLIFSGETKPKPLVKAGEYSGTKAQTKRAVGIVVLLGGKDADKFVLEYAIKTKTNTIAAQNGAECRLPTTDKKSHIMGLQLTLRLKG